MKSKWGKIELRLLAAGWSFRLWTVFLVLVIVLVMAAAAPELWARRHHRQIETFSTAKMIIEFNSSANEGVGDVGIQVFLDGEPWRSLKIESPDGRTILDVKASRSLRSQGLSEFFFESSEPSLDEVPLEEFLARFPEGEYEFEGKTIEGIRIEGKATLTHVIPCGPKNLIFNGSVISWEVVNTVVDTASKNGNQVECKPDPSLDIVAYQVIVERADNDELGAAQSIFDIKLPATSDPTQSVTVPPQFLESGATYKFEVLAIEAGGNQTITEGTPFTTPE